MSYNNTKLVAGLLGYALLACSISGCSFDSVSYSPSKEYSSIVISCADLKEEKDYTLVAGDTNTSVSLDQK